ncbi:hypothetical protein Acsp01_41940 [Actinoplanes sp. NBRC 101535]|nr:hypothetical protein Acsp01_41940 [Actinoplanes sp. NBRC 101535]
MVRAVWNRAAGGDGSGTGDRHLGALLLVDGMVQNGGANHAADSCSTDELAAAAVGARYFGMGDLAGLIEELPKAAGSSDDDEAEERLSAAWHATVPDSARLEAAFEERLAAAPQDFDPV